MDKFSDWAFGLQSDPEFAQAILGGDLNRLQDILWERHHQKSELSHQKEKELVSSPSDVLFVIDG